MSVDQKETSFVHWQSVTIEQLTHGINLILGLSTAGLGFEISLLLKNEFNPISWQKPFFLISLLLFLFSICFGILCVINRLRDFRATKNAARLREKGAASSEVKKHRDIYERLGKRTWKLFWFQIVTFGLGILLVVVAIGGVVWKKFF